MTNTAVDLKADVVRPITLAEKSALERLVAMVKETKDKPFCGDLGKFERELKERLDAVGRDVVGDEIAKAEINAPAVRIGRTEYRRVLEDSPETYMTTFGPVSVHRTLYKDREDPLERAVAMLELRVGIVGGFWTPEAAKQATWVVAQMTPGLGEELFRRLGHMGPSKSSLDRLPKEISARWEDDRKAFEAQLRTTLVVPSDAATVAPSLDGVLVPMNDVAEDRAEKRTKDGKAVAGGPAGYREVGCATVTFYDEAGDMLSAIRMARMPQERKVDLKEMLLAELAVVHEQRPDLRVVKVADACKDNWEFLSKKVRVGTEVVDYYHATEHLNTALQAAYGKGTGDQRRRFQELGDVLLNEPDGVDRVIASLRYLSKEHPKSAILKRETKFFSSNKARMRYAALRADFLPVGSGPMEAACKTLASQRMKQSGMRWGEDGGQAILTTRGWSQSGRFDEAWALLAATYKVEVTLMTKVVDLETYRKSPKRRSG
jgi:hypothetical protein